MFNDYVYPSDSTELPLYVRQAAAKAEATRVAPMPGGFQLMDDEQAAEYIRAIELLGA